MVVLYHARVTGFAGGFVGVDVFFVISGFVIGGSLLRELDRSGSVDVAAFYGRRVRRLVPAFIPVMGFAIVGSVLILPLGAVQVAAARTAIASVFSAANLYLFSSSGEYFATDERLDPLLHTWSLGVEEQFYLVLPAMFALLVRAGSHTRWSSRRLVVGVVGLASASSLVAAVVIVGSGGESAGFYLPHLRFWEIGAGVLVAALPPVGVHMAVARASVGAAVTALTVCTMAYDSSTAFPGLTALPVVLSTALLIVFGQRSDMWRRATATTPAQWIGDRSYGWYLWHWPFVVFASATIGASPIVLTLAAGSALLPTVGSYQWIESPTRRAHGLRGGRLGGVFAATIAVLLLICMGFSAGAARAWGVQADLGHPDNASHVNGCHAVVEPSEDCVFRPTGRSHGTIMLVGDSHAASLSDGVIAAGNELGYTVMPFTQNSCVFSEAEVELDPETAERCVRYRAAAWQLIADTAPEVVLVAQASSAYMSAPHGSELRVAAIDQWSVALRLTRDRVALTGSRLISIDVVPVFLEDFDDRLSFFSRTPAGSTMTLAEVDANRGDVLEAEHSVMGVDHIDPVPALCPGQVCSSVDPTSGTWLYFDPSHLNRSGSLIAARALTPQLSVLLGG